MFPIRKVTGVIAHPARTAGAVAGATFGASVGAATAGMRTTARVVGWALGRAGGPAHEQAPSTWPEPEGEPAPAAETTAPGEPPVKKAPVKKAPVKKTAVKKTAVKKTAAKGAAKKTPAKKAPSKKAAVMAPALGLTEAEVADELRTPSGIPAAGEGINPDTTETDLHQPGTEPLVDPATAKAVASESEMLRRAADPDKG